MASGFQVDSTIAHALESGHTLPARWYTNNAVFAAEKERIFHRSWQYVGHAGQVAKPGDFITTKLGDIPVVIARDTDGGLRAFANVCRHRGSEVVLECAGNRKTLQCHYHGWTYNLDGTLRNAPRANEQQSFAKEELSLIPFAIETWGPMIFVKPNREPGSLRDVIGNLPSLFDSARIDLTRLRMYRQDVYDIAANWKIIIENFNECYHCPIAHPAFSELIDTDKYSVDTEHEYYSTYCGPLLRSREPGVTYATLWPTAMIALSSMPMAMQVLCTYPIDAGHTRETIDYYFAEGTSDDQIRQYKELADLVQREDVVLCESVQRGLAAGIIENGTLMLSRERGIQHFQRLVHRFLSSAD
ncbi:MAG TPA: aromatic ring-hydroxylating dioxygenase subunit alpha [Candidatus Binataceae bacterium]|nr:aromatic ring-hydroxylating dioxygenase subunit alpha [Candidatus Binataceae bacterium]